MTVLRSILAVAAFAAVTVNAQHLLTEGDWNDTNPAIYGKGVVWVRDGHALMYWNGKSTSVIHESAVGIDPNQHNYQDRLASAGKLVAWAEGGDIHVWNGKTVTRLTDDAYEDSLVATDGKWVVWQKEMEGGSEIMLWDGKAVVRLTDNDWDDAWPDVSKGRIVWRADGDGVEAFEDIMLWSGGETVNLCAQLSVNAGTDDRPAIEGNLIAWIGENDDFFTVFLYDGVQLRDIGQGRQPESVGIAAGTVYWDESNDRSYAWRQGELVLDTSGRYPCAYGNHLACSDGDTLDIFVHNIKGMKAVQFTSTTNEEMFTRMGKGRIAWQRQVGPKGKVLTFPGPAKLP